MSEDGGDAGRQEEKGQEKPEDNPYAIPVELPVAKYAKDIAESVRNNAVTVRAANIPRWQPLAREISDLNHLHNERTTFDTNHHALNHPLPHAQVVIGDTGSGTTQSCSAEKKEKLLLFLAPALLTPNPLRWRGALNREDDANITDPA